MRWSWRLTALIGGNLAVAVVSSLAWLALYQRVSAADSLGAGIMADAARDPIQAVLWLASGLVWGMAQVSALRRTRGYAPVAVSLTAVAVLFLYSAASSVYLARPVAAIARGVSVYGSTSAIVQTGVMGLTAALFIGVRYGFERQRRRMAAVSAAEAQRVGLTR